MAWTREIELGPSHYEGDMRKLETSGCLESGYFMCGVGFTTQWPQFSLGGVETRQTKLWIYEGLEKTLLTLETHMWWKEALFAQGLRGIYSECEYTTLHIYMHSFYKNPTQNLSKPHLTSFIYLFILYLNKKLHFRTLFILQLHGEYAEMEFITGSYRKAVTTNKVSELQ